MLLYYGQAEYNDATEANADMKAAEYTEELSI